MIDDMYVHRLDHLAEEWRVPLAELQTAADRDLGPDFYDGTRQRVTADGRSWLLKRFMPDEIGPHRRAND